MGLIYNYFFSSKEYYGNIDISILGNLKSYINDTSNIYIDDLSKSNNESVYKAIIKYIKNEKYLFPNGNDIIYKYFNCENKTIFNSENYINKNIKITNEFRYFGLFLYFGNPESFMLNFYHKIFLNVNKIIGGSFYNDDMDQKMIGLDLRIINKKIEWIVIIPCYHFPLLIEDILKYDNIHSILIHCHGKHNHKEKYLKSFPKYKGFFTNHNELINKLKYINKNYTICSLNYSLEKENNYKKYNFSYGSNIKSDINNAFKKLYEINYNSYDTLTINFNTPNQLILKYYLYYKDIQEKKKHLKEEKEEIKFFENFIKMDENISSKEKLELCEEFIPKLYLVCYYYLSYYYSNPFKKPINEIKKIIKEVNESDKNKLYILLGNIIIECYNKIINGESIMVKNIVNEFHNILIKILIIEEGNINIFKYLECLSDFDLCLQLIFDILDEKGNNKIGREIIEEIMKTNKRLGLMPYYYDIDEYNKTKTTKNSELNEKQINQFNEGVKIKNILVIYDNNELINSIKSLELPYKIIYIKNEKDKLDEFFSKFTTDEYNFRIMKYYIITTIEIGNELFNTFNFHIFNSGYSLVFIFLCRQNTLIAKSLLASGIKLSCICLYSYESIQEYLLDIKNVYKSIYSISLNDLNYYMNEIDNSNKTIFNPMKFTEEADNGFDIILDINPCTFINNHLIRDSNLISLQSFIIGMYELYKEKDGLNIYFQKYSKYLGVTSCLEEQINNNAFIKQVIYVYTREEGKNRAGEPLSFYCLINNDLRSGEFNKIKRYAPLLYIIKDSIFRKNILTYNNTIYRGTWLKPDFIKKLKIGLKIFSPCFWSCSKDKDVALGFVKNYKKNVLLILNNNKNNNIDIDEEKLSNFPEEKEVLVLPFCSFEITDIKIINNEIKFYEITLEYIFEKFENNKIVNLPVNEIKDD